tara:strand:- start:63 stop:419 length:357 start_codon:yes stop_codon:yes gene_type:complete
MITTRLLFILFSLIIGGCSLPEETDVISKNRNTPAADRNYNLQPIGNGWIKDKKYRAQEKEASQEKTEIKTNNNAHIKNVGDKTSKNKKNTNLILIIIVYSFILTWIIIKKLNKKNES